MPRFDDEGFPTSRRGSTAVPDRRPAGFGVKTIVIGVVVIIVALWALIDVWNAFRSGETGQVGVVRNGGPFDNKSFRGILPVNAGPTWIGFHSGVRFYPTSERYDNLVPGAFNADPAAGDSLDVDAYRTNTKDGVNIGVKGQFKYTVNQNPDVLAKFDQDYGQRTYQVPNSDERLAVSDEDRGFGVFIAGQVRPLEEETIRQVIGENNCPDLDASCTVLQYATNPDPAAAAAALKNAPSNSAVFQAAADRIGSLMTEKLKPALGDDYLINVRFLLTGVDLPPPTREAISRVQTAGAGAAEARANAARATAEAEGRAATAAADATANENRQRGYNACPTCAQLDQIRATGDAMSKLPSGLQTYVPGGGTGLNLNLPSR